MKSYKLDPITQKSFYGKANIYEHDGIFYLFSYDTCVARYDANGFKRLWDGWSATTQKHVNAFRVKVCGLPAMSKKSWCNLPVAPTFDNVDEMLAFCDE